MAVLHSSTDAQPLAAVFPSTEAEVKIIFNVVKIPLEALQKIAESQASLENKQLAINAIVTAEKPMPLIVKNSFFEAIEKGQIQVASLIVDTYQTNLADPTNKEVNSILSQAFALAEKNNKPESVKFLIQKFPEKFLNEKNHPFLESYLRKASANNHLEIVSYLVGLQRVGYKLGTLSSVYTTCPQVRQVFSDKIRTEIETHQRISSLKTGISSGVMTTIISFPLVFFSSLLIHMGQARHELLRTGRRPPDAPLSDLIKEVGYQLLGSISLGLFVGLIDCGRRIVQQRKETKLPFRELLNFSSDDRKIVSNK